MRRVASGQFDLNVPAERAISFFTPEGERAWVPGWNPTYPTGEPSEEEGTVFVTTVHGVETIWMIHSIDRSETSAAYLRATPEHHAGTVRVRCNNTRDGGCVVVVTYDMSLLPGSDPAGLDAYDDASFEVMMNEWSEAVGQIS